LWGRAEQISFCVRYEPTRRVEKKLAAIREATKHEFPSPDIHAMLEEIARGYDDGTRP
jgi:hypothetical protein